MNIETSRLSITLTEKPDAEMDPQAVLRVFNSNPDFIDDSEGRIGKFAYSLDEVKAWAMFKFPLRKHQRYFAIRPLCSVELIGMGDMLTPHPRGNYAALGLIMRRLHQPDLLLHRASRNPGSLGSSSLRSG